MGERIFFSAWTPDKPESIAATSKYLPGEVLPDPLLALRERLEAAVDRLVFVQITLTEGQKCVFSAPVVARQVLVSLAAEELRPDEGRVAPEEGRPRPLGAVMPLELGAAVLLHQEAPDDHVHVHLL